MCKYCSYIENSRAAEKLSATTHFAATSVSAGFPEAPDAAGDSSTTYTLGAGQTVQGAIATLGDHDWYRINLVAGQTYTFSLTSSGTPAFDTYLRLYNAANTQIAYDDDSGVGSNSSLTFTAT